MLGFDSGSDQQMFIKYTQKAGHYKDQTNQLVNINTCQWLGEKDNTSTMNGWQIQV